MPAKSRDLHRHGPREGAVPFLDDVLGVDQHVEVCAFERFVDGGFAFPRAGPRWKIIPGYSANSRSPDRKMPSTTLVWDTA